MAVHTATTLADIAVSLGLIAAACLIDIFKCFEVLDHNVIVRECRRAGFPLDILAVALSMYSAGRYIFYQGAMGGPAFSHSGITAGCTFAVFILRATLQPCMDQLYVEQCAPKRMVMQIFVDDLMLMQMGTVADVPRQIAHAAACLVEVLNYLKSLGRWTSALSLLLP